MSISGVSPSSRNSASPKQSAPDNHETSLRKQITRLQEEMRTISNDKEMPDDQKSKKKQSVQEQIQNLNSELRQYQIQKRQEEAAKKQESIKQATENAGTKETRNKETNTKDAGIKKTGIKETNTKDAGIKETSVKDTGIKETNVKDTGIKEADIKETSAKDTKIKENKNDAAVKDTGNSSADTRPAVSGSEESGVLISLSTAKEQMADMRKVRTSLEARQRTATTEEEKASLQKKIDNVTKSIGKKIVITEDTISSFRKTGKPGTGSIQGRENASKQKADAQKAYDENLDVLNRTGVINNKKMFDNIAMITN